MTHYAAEKRRMHCCQSPTELPQLLRSSHLLISKAGGAITQEAIAAGCPIIVNQIVPGQEEGNARLIADNAAGTVAISNSEVVAANAEKVARDAMRAASVRLELADIASVKAKKKAGTVESDLPEIAEKPLDLEEKPAAPVKAAPPK